MIQQLIIPAFYTVYADICDYDLGITCERRPDIPAPQRAEEKISRPGNTDLVRDLGYYEDIEISVPYNFYVRNPAEWGETYRKAKNVFLKNPGKRLILSDSKGYFWKVTGTPVIDSTEREIMRKGRFDVTFTCEGLQYLAAGDTAVTVTSQGTGLYNHYETAQPLYQITGEGVCTLTVNGNAITANVGQNLTIDTDLWLAYRTDSGEMNNTAISGDYEDMYLTPGENTISITNGFDLQVIPRWRTL